MSIFVIGDEDTVLGVRLVGGDGTVVASRQEAETALDAVMERQDLELLLMTYQWAQHTQDRLNRIKMTETRPLVMEIPDKSGGEPQHSAKDLVSRAIGIDV